MTTVTLRPVSVDDPSAGSDPGTDDGTFTAFGTGAIGDESDSSGIMYEQRVGFPDATYAIASCTLEASAELAGQEITALRVFYRAAALTGRDGTIGVIKTVQVRVGGQDFVTSYIQAGNDGTTGDNGGGPDFALREYRSHGLVATYPAEGPPPGGFGDVLAPGATLRLTVSDASVSEVWVEADYDGVEWPLRVVDAGGPAYRIGPDWNPDGGLLRIVDPATGQAWKQGTTGTPRPLRYFDPVLGVVTTLPMILDT